MSDNRDGARVLIHSIINCHHKGIFSSSFCKKRLICQTAELHHDRDTSDTRVLQKKLSNARRVIVFTAAMACPAPILSVAARQKEMLQSN
jgi:hypothetical protein